MCKIQCVRYILFDDTCMKKYVRCNGEYVICKVNLKYVMCKWKCEIPNL